jgi:4-amino-4-deoxy-L-arabinose transferase-like glycosyltransferase
LFVAAFIVMMSLSAKKYDRYLLPVYAPLDLLSGLGWASLAMVLLERRSRATLRLAGYAVPLAAVFIQAALAVNTYPYYFTYYNPLLGGSRVAPQVMQIGWGEGLDQAAAYLNKKPGAEKLRAISSLTTGCFSYFFKGFDREMPYLDDPSAQDDDWQKFIESDYAVIYISQMQREISPPILEYVSQLEPEHTVWIDGLEYARIYKLP